MRRFKHGKHDAGGKPAWMDAAFAAELDASAGRGFERRHRAFKAQQLCRQVERALSLALAGECGDDVLRDLCVHDVTPADDGNHLIVRLSVPASLSLADVLERLERSRPRLRALVAQAITRKRVPELSFIPVPAGSVRAREDVP